MTNMSYCRFQNTLRDLEDCRDAMHNIEDGVEAKPTGAELDALRTLVGVALEVVQAACAENADDAMQAEDCANRWLTESDAILGCDCGGWSRPDGSSKHRTVGKQQSTVTFAGVEASVRHLR